MEALSTIIVAPFTNYDICKAIDSEMVINEVIGSIII
jgi:molybdenum cofactor biosynthesis enzyme